MGRAYSMDLRERVVAAVAQEGLSRRQAAARFGVSDSTAINWLKRVATTGSVAPGLSGILCAGPVDHHARMNLSSNMMANWVFASPHSRGDIFHSVAV